MKEHHDDRHAEHDAHELVRRTLLDEHGDFLKAAVAIVAAQLMDAEITAQIGAAHGEVSADRVTHRNGYRSRGWETRVGEIELQIPKKRSGRTFRPSSSRAAGVSRRSSRS
jgi:putative transposase